MSVALNGADNTAPQLLAHLDEARAVDPRGRGEEAHDCNKQTELLGGPV
eukprot:CAMPEP_0179986320 /NCGR_PEP_ID=MMETSP0984-20121128/2166_1 /TAXON_ID=483367 /ORGANISM="non described non described, Strain CCMP 2436" /LENGTH=48 /DNA_ID= /DNA_START= /DNA_END= /DNA_ORIENTATION=